MCWIGSSISLAVALLLASTTATEAPVMEPRMVGAVDAGRLYVEHATVVEDDLVFLGTRGRERLSLRWFDADKDRERKLSVVGSGEMPRALASFGDGIIFTGFRGREGTEPWRSDGTRAGTKLIRQIHRGRQSATCVSQSKRCPTFPAGSDPSFFLEMDGHSYFAANHPRYGRELWRTNGTHKGTRLVKDIDPGPGSGLGFAGTTLVEFQGALYFVADDGQHGRELWRTDGTRKGTRMVRDVGTGHSVPRWDDAVSWWDAPVVAGDLLYFGAARREEGLELWRTDGTREGTRLVRDIRPGRKASNPGYLTAVSDLLYFIADDGVHGRELWRTDGTRGGTVLVADLTPGREPSGLISLMALGDSLYFSRWDPSDELSRTSELWRADAAIGGIGPVTLGADEPDALRRRWSEYSTRSTAAGRLFFTADDGIHGNELWLIESTTAEPVLVADVHPGPEDSDPEWLMPADATLYFTADDGEHGRQLWALPLPNDAEDEAIR